MCSRVTLASFEDKCICRISELVWMFGEPESNSSLVLTERRYRQGK